MNEEKGGNPPSNKSRQKNVLFYLAIVFFVLVLAELAYIVSPTIRYFVARKTYNINVEKAEVDKAECLNFFNRAPEVYENDITTDPYVASDLATCKALESKDISHCDILKKIVNDSLGLYEKCKMGAGDMLFNILPMVENGECSQEGEYYTDGFYEICEVYVNNDPQFCESLDDSVSKQTCLAVYHDNPLECDSLPVDVPSEDRFGGNGIEVTVERCRDIYYFLKALKTNDRKYVNSIESQDTLTFAEWYFDRDTDCRTMIERNLPDKCDEYLNFKMEYCNDECPGKTE